MADAIQVVWQVHQLRRHFRVPQKPSSLQERHCQRTRVLDYASSLIELNVSRAIMLIFMHMCVAWQRANDSLTEFRAGQSGVEAKVDVSRILIIVDRLIRLLSRRRVS